MKRFCVIDGNSYIHRAYHALPPMRTASGLAVNAIYGFARMVLKLIREQQPDYIAVAFDYPAPTFRHKQFPEYKAQRKPADEELKQQIPLAHELVKVFGFGFIEKEGFEADDIIATLARRAEKQGMETVIVTGDKDALQLVSDRVKVLNEPKAILYDSRKVEEIVGITPDKMVEMMALCGDVVDNIPGVRGIGEKTAVKLIQKFATIQNLYQHLEGVEKEGLRNLLADQKASAFLSRQLVSLKTDVPLQMQWDNFKLADFKSPELVGFFKRMGFVSLLKEVISREDERTLTYRCVRQEKDFLDLLRQLKTSMGFAVDLETTSVFPMLAEIVGISISFKQREAWYIPLGHRCLGAGKQLSREYVLNQLKPVLENSQIPKYGQNIKYDLIILKKYGVDLSGVKFDTMLASYLLNPSRQNHNLSELAIEYLGIKPTAIGELLGKGRAQTTMDLVQIEKVTPYACADADLAGRLKPLMEQQLKKKNLAKLFYELELPLMGVLARMETVGVKIDPGYLKNLSAEFQTKLTLLEKQIYNLAGEKFNLNSSRQVGEILFGKLKLPSIKRTKTGYSTREDVLIELASRHELPGRILEYRELQKLKSTYIDALPKLVNPNTGRVHTSFNQAVTATGRLSSSDPNLQNIPVRTELGNRIRKAFIAEEGSVLLSFDYSQIDLRVLAHISEDVRLCEAFRCGEDIHRQTAAEVFGVKLEAVTPQMRKSAKAINFGIVYGMSAYGLSRRLGISRQEAAHYIEGYFAKYKGVKKWTGEIIARARQDGYVTTLLNRRRYLPEINSPDANLRGFAERTAINTPIQGSAADLIKLAMINIHRRLCGLYGLHNPFVGADGSVRPISGMTRRSSPPGYQAKMLIQVHDELLFELPEEEVQPVAKMVKFEMENALQLEVPIKVDVKVGKNWSEMKTL